jgi:hypothetical protein
LVCVSQHLHMFFWAVQTRSSVAFVVNHEHACV